MGVGCIFAYFTFDSSVISTLSNCLKHANIQKEFCCVWRVI